jgi:lipopolysaccharide transport system permease protein
VLERGANPIRSPEQNHGLRLAWPLGRFWSKRQLIWQLTKREVVGRYRGSVLGIGWSLFHPLLMLAVYTFVLGSVFKMRWGAGASETGLQYSLSIFAGMIVHGLFAECLNRAPNLILSNPSYVKKVVFPLDTLALVTMGSSLFHLAVSTVVLIGGLLIANSSIHPTVLLIPLVLLPFLLLTLGLVWFLAATGVYLRDIGQSIGVLTTVLMFLAPVLYPVSAVPEQYRWLLFLNPLTFVIEQFRNLAIVGVAPDWIGLMAYAVLGSAVAAVGYVWFQKTRDGFADVL